MLDSLYFSSSPSEEFESSLFKAIGEVSQNTDAFTGMSLLVTIVSVVAALVTIFGLVSLLISFRARRVGKRCQRSIFLDLMRHIFTVLTHIEAIRAHMNNGNSKGKTLREGMIERFCFIDSDLELSGTRFTARSFEKLHSIREKMRNYNSVSMIAEKHFTDSICPEDIREEDLEDLWHRSRELAKDILEYTEKARLHLSETEISTYIRTYYNKEDRIPKWKKEGKIDMTAELPDRDQNHALFDQEGFGLTDIMDTCIRARLNKVRFR